jgi:hypothetical protein
MLTVVQDSDSSNEDAGGSGDPNVYSGRLEIGDIRESRNLRLGDDSAIRRTSLTSGDTMLVWTALGTVACSESSRTVVWIVRRGAVAGLTVLQ